MAYAAAPFFEINQFFAKASLLILYYRIFSVDRTFVVCTFISAAIQLAWFIAVIFSLIFMCVPVSKWWDVLDSEDGWCLNDAALLCCRRIYQLVFRFRNDGVGNIYGQEDPTEVAYEEKARVCLRSRWSIRDSRLRQNCGGLRNT